VNPSAGSLWLTAAGACSLVIALAHLGAIAIGPAAWRFMQAPELAEQAQRGAWLRPVALTLAVTAVFVAWGAYAWSGAGRLPRLPLLRPALVAIAAVYTLRGALVVYQARHLFPPDGYPARFIVFSLVALAVGALHVAGVFANWNALAGAAPR